MKVTIRTKELKDGNKSIYLDVYDKGKRKYEYLRLYLVPEVDEKAKRQNANAMRQAQKMKAEYVLGASELLKKQEEKPKEMTLQEWMEIYEKRICEREVSEAAVRQTKLTNLIISGYLASVRKKNIKLKDVGRKEVQGILKAIGEHKGERKDHYAAHTIYTMQKRVIALFNAAKQEGHIEHSPMDFLSDKERFTKPISDRPYLTIEEVERFAAVDARYPVVRDAFVFACLTGLRISDIRSLKWEDVQDVGSRPTIVKRQVNTKNVVAVPICDTALRYMPSHRFDEYVFHLPDKSTLRNEIIRIAEAAEIAKHISFHTSRHTFATLSMTAGSDLKTVSTLLGHSSVGTTVIYADVEMKSKKDAVNGLLALFK